MAGTYTARLRLYKPDGDDNVDEITDLNNNYDRLDALVSFVPVTVSTYPASAFQGQAFYEVDTGEAYVNKSAVASASDYWQLLTAGSTFHADIDMDADYQVNIGNSASPAKFAARVPFGTDLLTSQIISASAFNSFYLEANGTMGWGDGTATQDTTFYRDSADTMGIGPNLIVEEDLIVGDTVYGTDAEFSGDVTIGSAVLRPQLHVVISHSNSTTEKAIQTVAIPANDAVVGSTYRIRLFGGCTVTGTPTMNFRIRMGDQVTGDNPVTMGAITCRSGMTDGYWELEALLTLTANAGASATWHAMCKLTHNFLTGVGTYTTVGPIMGSVTKDSTVAFDFHVVADWGTASPSNIIVARGGQSGRVC